MRLHRARAKPRKCARWHAVIPQSTLKATGIDIPFLFIPPLMTGGGEGRRAVINVHKRKVRAGTRSKISGTHV